jgi:uncharacterized metal-binding protein YceD (DUF177 family)
MPLIVNLRHLEAHNIRLQGSLPLGDLEIDPLDEVIQLRSPLDYDLEVQMLEDGVLVQGRLHLILECQCVRCLKRFQHHIELDKWTRHLPLEGEDRVPVDNDCVDLTPYVREDILLEFPRHPLCDAECRGLPRSSIGKSHSAASSGKPGLDQSAWAELNKLKL